MADKFTVTRYTQQQLDDAKTKGQVIGWLQGGAVTFGALMLFKFLGWIPLIVLLVVLGVFGFKFWKFLQKDEFAEDV